MPDDTDLHVVACWISATGTVVVTGVEFDANARTIFGANTTGSISGLDVVVPAGDKVQLSGGTGGFFGWEEPAIG